MDKKYWPKMVVDEELERRERHVEEEKQQVVEQIEHQFPRVPRH